MTNPTWYQNALDNGRRIGDLQVFFIIGCQKSGTTWLQRLLNAHPRIACNAEGHFTDVLGPLLEIAIGEYNRTDKATHQFTSDDLLSSVRLLCDQRLHCYARQKPPGVTAVGDKTPEAALALPMLDRLYPHARFIHIIRDGRDAAVSGWAQLGRLGQRGRFKSFPEYAAYFARHHWRAYIAAARTASANLGERYLEVRYESMHGDARTQTERMLEFLGVDASPADVELCVEAGSFSTLSGGRARGETAADSHFRRGIIGEWSSTFDEESESRFHSEAGDLLASLGYIGKVEPQRR